MRLAKKMNARNSSWTSWEECGHQGEQRALAVFILRLRAWVWIQYMSEWACPRQRLQGWELALFTRRCTIGTDCNLRTHSLQKQMARLDNPLSLAFGKKMAEEGLEVSYMLQVTGFQTVSTEQRKTETPEPVTHILPGSDINRSKGCRMGGKG